MVLLMLDQQKKVALFPLLLITCIVLGVYAVGISVASFNLALQVANSPKSAGSAVNDHVVVTLIIESKVESAPLNVTYIVTARINQTLETVLKEVLGPHLKGRDYPGMGFYVASIFNLEEKVNGTGWVYQAYDPATKQWVSPSVGVSYYYITESTAIRFTFLP